MTKNRFEALFTDQSKVLRLILIVSAIPLCIAYILEFGFGKIPCAMCVYERYPYFIGLFAAILGLTVPAPKIKEFCIITASFFFLVGIFVTLYHIGIEEKIFALPELCKAPKLSAHSLEDMESLIASRPIVRCDIASMKINGISLTVFNVFYGILALDIGLLYFIQKKKNGSR